MILHWNKNKMFLFHSAYNDFAVKQKQNVSVSLSSQWFCSETKTKCFGFTALFLALLAFHNVVVVVGAWILSILVILVETNKPEIENKQSEIIVCKTAFSK